MTSWIYNSTCHDDPLLAAVTVDSTGLKNSKLVHRSLYIVNFFCYSPPAVLGGWVFHPEISFFFFRQGLSRSFSSADARVFKGGGVYLLTYMHIFVCYIKSLCFYIAFFISTALVGEARFSRDDENSSASTFEKINLCIGAIGSMLSAVYFVLWKNPWFCLSTVCCVWMYLY